jgi:hypothetical protein
VLHSKLEAKRCRHARIGVNPYFNACGDFSFDAFNATSLDSRILRQDRLGTRCNTIIPYRVSSRYLYFSG